MLRNSLRIRAVEADSPADKAGLAPGDEILSMSGHPIPDELALKFYLADEEYAEFEVSRKAGTVCIGVALDEGQGLGIEVEDFRTRTCANACLFCFVNQLPPTARASLKIKDDDYRLSFLHGNYITLTNLADRELERIIEQALSPLYVSVHATDPELRTRIMGRRKIDDLAHKLSRLIHGGIRIHAQIVLLPGINDGPHLQRTVFDLFDYHPGVESVAIVPLGLSDFSSDALTPVTPEFCRRIIDQVTPWQAVFRQKTGRAFAYMGDEFFIQGGYPIPEAAAYDNFAQIEDGIGMARRFLDEFATHLSRRRKPKPRLHATLATGKLFFPFLRQCAEQFNQKLGSNLQVIEVENRFLGRTITVAGLLSGQDFAHALAGRSLGDFVIIPNEAISQGEGVFLDDLTPADLSKQLGKPVHLGGPTMRALFSRLQMGPRH